MYNSRKTMMEAFGPMAGFQQDKMVHDFEKIEYHPGAIKFYKEKGLWKDK